MKNLRTFANVNVIVAPPLHVFAPLIGAAGAFLHVIGPGSRGCRRRRHQTARTVDRRHLHCLNSHGAVGCALPKLSHSVRRIFFLYIVYFILHIILFYISRVFFLNFLLINRKRFSSECNK